MKVDFVEAELGRLDNYWFQLLLTCIPNLLILLWVPESSRLVFLELVIE